MKTCVSCTIRSPLSPQIKFTVVLETDSDRDWEVQIWHNIGVSEWSALKLQECPSNAVPDVSQSHTFRTRRVFEAEAPRPPPGPGNFTIRYEVSGTDQWQWANLEHQVADGELIFQSSSADLPSSSAEDLAKYFDNLSPEVTIRTRKSESSGAALWHLSGPVDSAGSGPGGSGLASVPLGTPSCVSRFFALVRQNVSWLAPRQGRDKIGLDKDALLCSFLRKDGVHVVLLGVSIDGILTILKSGPKGEMMINSQNDNPEPSTFQVLAAAATEFEIAMSALIYEARKLVSPYTLPESPTTQWFSNWQDGLIYCTWNGLGQDLSEEKLLSALDDLKNQDINISSLIIDDNWQSLDNEGADSSHRGWTQFEANPKTFPNGLAKTISIIKQRHPNIKTIAVWHALFGYWGGISPSGPLATKYKTRTVPLTMESPSQSTLLAIDPSDIQPFYNDFYTFLSSSGISAVKADAQSTLDLLANAPDRTSLTKSYLTAQTISSLHHFGPNSIACMAQFPQGLFHSHIPVDKPATTLRNSDDYFPNEPDSHAWHVFSNAHNALFTRYLNVTPDWDIFQTDPAHPFGGFHAAARCVSGGPIGITDTPGKHDKSIINQITAPTTQGNTVILRPDLIGRTMDTYDSTDEGHFLKIGTYHGRAGTGSGILGVFNISKTRKSELVRMDEFPGIYTSDHEKGYIVRAHRTGKIAEDLNPTSMISITLEGGGKGWDILTAYPCYQFTWKKGSTGVSVLGLLEKMTGVAGLVRSEVYVESNRGLRVDVRLKALGVLGVYFSELPGWDIDDYFMVLLAGRAVPRKTVRKEDGKVLAIDVKEAWEGMGLKAGWGNEVDVSILL